VFERSAAPYVSIDGDEYHPTDVALSSSGIVIDRGAVTVGTAHDSKDMVRLHAGNADAEGCLREGASPLARHLQIKALIGVWKSKMAGGSGSTPAALEPIARAAPAGMMASDPMPRPLVA
jgi:hypothetical protein